jgi:Mg-chelatase subunit ChlD
LLQIAFENVASTLLHAAPFASDAEMQEIIRTMLSLRVDGGTCYAPALEQVRALLRRQAQGASQLGASSSASRPRVGSSHVPVLVFLSDGEPFDRDASYATMRSLCAEFPSLQVQCVHFAGPRDVVGQSVLRTLASQSGPSGVMRLAADNIELAEEFAQLVSSIDAQTATMQGARG